jgi:hypothetical protein
MPASYANTSYTNILCQLMPTTTVVYPEALQDGTRVTCEPLPSLLRTVFIVHKEGAQLAFNALQSIRRAGKQRFHFPIREYGLVV